MQLQLGLVLALVLISGVWGWRSARRRWRSLYDQKPGGMSDEAYHRRQYRHHVFRRLAYAALYAAIGAAAGWGIGLSLRLP